MRGTKREGRDWKRVVRARTAVDGCGCGCGCELAVVSGASNSAKGFNLVAN